MINTMLLTGLFDLSTPSFSTKLPLYFALSMRSQKCVKRGSWVFLVSEARLHLAFLSFVLSHYLTRLGDFRRRLDVTEILFTEL